MDRNQIKWLPFNSITALSGEIRNLRYQKSKSKKPTLCDDKLDKLNYIIKEAFENHENIIVEYYLDGFKYNKLGTIKTIKSNKIIFQDEFWVFLNQILNIKII